MSLRVIIIDQDAECRQTIRNTLMDDATIEIVAETENQIYGYELIRYNNPNLVFIDVHEHQPQKSLETIQRISTYFKNTLVVASGEGVSMERVLACMQAGAREYISRPIQKADIERIMVNYGSYLSIDTSAGDTTGRLLTVFSNKGGLGKTTIAVNLALALSETVQQPVALVDLNLQLGDITTFLNIKPKQTIVDIAKNIGRVDAAYLESSLAEYRNGRGRVFVLADPLHVEDAEEISAEQINTVLTILKATFPYVIIDTSNSFDSKTLTALDLANNILLVSMVNLPTIRSTQRVLSLFDRLEYDKEKVKILVNRYIPDEEISIEDVEDTLEHPIYWKIPNNYNVVMTAINRGIPISEVEKSDSMHQNFLDMAANISGVLHPRNTGMQRQGGRQSLLKSLFGKK